MNYDLLTTELEEMIKQKRQTITGYKLMVQRLGRLHRPRRRVIVTLWFSAVDGEIVMPGEIPLNSFHLASFDPGGTSHRDYIVTRTEAS